MDWSCVNCSMNESFMHHCQMTFLPSRNTQKSGLITVPQKSVSSADVCTHTFLQRHFYNHREVLVMKNIKQHNQQRKHYETCGFSFNSSVYFKTSSILIKLFNVLFCFCAKAFIILSNSVMTNLNFQQSRVSHNMLKSFYDVDLLLKKHLLLLSMLKTVLLLNSFVETFRILWIQRSKE